MSMITRFKCNAVQRTVISTLNLQCFDVLVLVLVNGRFLSFYGMPNTATRRSATAREITE